MTRRFSVAYQGLDIEGDCYVGEDGSDPSECSIDSIGFDMLDSDGKHLWARLPDALQEHLVNDADWMASVEGLAFEQVRDGESDGDEEC